MREPRAASRVSGETASQDDQVASAELRATSPTVIPVVRPGPRPCKTPPLSTSTYLYNYQTITTHVPTIHSRCTNNRKEDPFIYLESNYFGRYSSSP